MVYTTALTPCCGPGGKLCAVGFGASNLSRNFCAIKCQLPDSDPTSGSKRDIGLRRKKGIFVRSGEGIGSL